MEKAAADFLSYLKIPISRRYVEQLIAAHPDFPSLLGVSDVFSRLGINHRVTRIDKDNLTNFDYPYLLPLDKGNGELLVIDSHESLRKNYNRLDQWGGVILLADTAKNTSDSENNILYSHEKKIKIYSLLASVVFMGLVVTSQSDSFTWTNVSLLTLALCGLGVGYFIFAKQFGITYSSIDAFCATGKNTDCDVVLNSEVSILGIKLSDATLIYFLFQTVLLAFGPLLTKQEHIISTLSALSLFTLPLIFFSLYYQYYIAKTWCRLCVLVVALLLGQAGIFAYAFTEGLITLQGISSPFLATLFMIGMFLLAIVLALKGIIGRYERLSQTGGTGNRIKHNAMIFLSILQKQRKFDDTPFENEMVVGSPKAPIKITLCSNLYCNPCKLRHEVVAQLLAMYPESIQLTMRFVKSGKDPDSVSHLLNFWYQIIRGKENEAVDTMSLVHDWFKIWDLRKFKEKYPVDTDKPEVAHLESQCYRWINEAGIRQTPTFIINGYELPQEYGIGDLLAMVPSLHNHIVKMEDKEMAVVMN